MVGRREERVRGNIACDVVVDGDVHKGTLVDLSASGLFVKMDLAELPARGAELELHVAEIAGAGAMVLHGEVSRRVPVPSFLARSGGRGIGVRITEAPDDFHAVLMHGLDGSVAALDGPGDVAPTAACERPSAVLFEVDTGVDDEAPDDAPIPREARVVPGEAEEDAELPVRAGNPPQTRHAGTPDHERALPARRPGPRTEDAQAPEVAGLGAAPAAVAVEADDTDMPGARAPRPSPAPSGQAPTGREDALLVYDGDVLDDVYELLDELGVKPLRARLSGPTRFEGWRCAPRLLVLSATDALSVRVPDDAEASGVVRMAISDSRSEVLGGLIARLGYDYLVRRPTQTEVLRMLLQHVLHRGPDARASLRRPAGWPVRLALGWQRIPATLVDLSRGGARLMVRSDVDLLAAPSLLLPRRLTGTRRMSLRARVIRKRRCDASGLTSVAVRFIEPLDPLRLAALAHALDTGTIGPAPAPDAAWPDRLRARWSSRCARREPVAAAGAAAAERRRMPRGRLTTEVPELDPLTRETCRVLVGRDLSVGGMRVEPHPELGVGEHRTLVLCDAVGVPFEVRARVVRDDGARGLALAFEDPDGATAARLDALVGTLAAVEVPDVVWPERVVFARIATRRAETRAR